VYLVWLVSGHPRIRTCGRIVLSAILAITDTARIAETENTLYEPGTPGIGELPDEWREAIDRFLCIA
jgi:hypothetical protein